MTTHDRRLSGLGAEHDTTDQAAEASVLRGLGLVVAQAVDEAASHRALRWMLLLLAELAIAGVSIVSAVSIVYSGEFWAWPPAVMVTIAAVAGLQLVIGWAAGEIRTRWRFVGTRDAMVIARAGVAASVVAYLVVQALGVETTALRLVVAYAALYVTVAGGSRLAIRWLHEWGRRARVPAPFEPRRAVIIGAGQAGATLIKTLLASPRRQIDPVALVDDAPANQGKLLHGVPIVGGIDEVGVVVSEYGADELIIAIPSATAEQMQRIVDVCLATKRPFRIAPDPEDALEGRRSSPLRVVQLGDLLGRPQVALNVAQVRAELSGARVLVTGAAGSIGSELVTQLAKLQPAHLYLVDRNENDLYFLCGDLARGAAVPYTAVLQDIRHGERMRRVMEQYRPTHVFHAAAFKHVPLMESHVAAAVENNVLGTWEVLEAARAAGVRKFVLISTDKAVEPSSVMGATKRFAEMLVSERTGPGGMRGVIVRFGNVLGSNGSVVPLFQRQIGQGGPVTVTDRTATRYFMTIAEASQLVLQATSLEGSPGMVAILDMGTPVRIWELAERLIALHGLRVGADIEIVETGLRPGEKLHEQLWWGTEAVEPSGHPKISLARLADLPGGVLRLLPDIRRLVDREDDAALREVLRRAVGLQSPEEQDAAQAASVVPIHRGRSGPTQLAATP